jgi:hypothetical protein
MGIRDLTRAVIKRVEDVSGCPVVVSEDASLKLWRRSRRKPEFVSRVQGIKAPVAPEKVYDFAPVRKIGAELAVKKWQPAP